MKKKSYIIFALITLSIFFTGITYSFFTSSKDGRGEQDLAKFVFNSEIVNEIDIPLINMQPGSEDNYTFQVKNTFEMQTTDVSVDYKITVKTYHFIPTIINLYKDDELLFTCDETNERNSDNEIECITDEYYFSYDDNNTHDYNLEVIFDPEFNTSEYMNLVDFLKIELNSYQKTKESSENE